MALLPSDLEPTKETFLPGEGHIRNAPRKQKSSEIDFLDNAITKGVCRGKISFSIENYVCSFNISQVLLLVIKSADPIGHAVKGVGLRQLTFWDCGFESRR
jgi:hypothetical protein